MGRHQDNDLVLADGQVSRRHARVVWEQGLSGPYVGDEGSTNGIYVKGRRVKEHILHHEDVVTIGEHQLRFLIVDAKRSTPPVTPETKEKTAVGKAAPVGKSDGPMGFLTIVGGKRDGERITLEEGLTKVGEPGIQVAAEVSAHP